MHVLKFSAEEGSKEAIITPWLGHHLCPARCTGDKQWSPQLAIACELSKISLRELSLITLVSFHPNRIMLKAHCSHKDTWSEKREQSTPYHCAQYLYTIGTVLLEQTHRWLLIKVVKSRVVGYKYDTVLLLAKNCWLSCPCFKSKHLIKPLLNSK